MLELLLAVRASKNDGQLSRNGSSASSRLGIQEDSAKVVRWLLLMNDFVSPTVLATVDGRFRVTHGVMTTASRVVSGMASGRVPSTLSPGFESVRAKLIILGFL